MDKSLVPCFLTHDEMKTDTLSKVTTWNLSFAMKISKLTGSSSRQWLRPRSTAGGLADRTQPGAYTTEQLETAGLQEALLLLTCTDARILQRPAQSAYNTIHLSDSE